MSHAIEKTSEQTPWSDAPAELRSDQDGAVTAPTAPQAPVTTPPSEATAPISAPPDTASTPKPSSRGSRPGRRPARRTRVVVRRIGPLSVLKFSLIFYFCAMLILFFALLIIYLVLAASGAVENFGTVLGYVFGNGEQGTRDPTPVTIDGRVVFTWVFFGGLVFSVVWSLINVFVAFLYNLISDIVGGIDVTLAEKPPR
jgi:hypothetical protein